MLHPHTHTPFSPLSSSYLALSSSYRCTCEYPTHLLLFVLHRRSAQVRWPTDSFSNWPSLVLLYISTPASSHLIFAAYLSTCLLASASSCGVHAASTFAVVSKHDNLLPIRPNCALPLVACCPSPSSKSITMPYPSGFSKRYGAGRCADRFSRPSSPIWNGAFSGRPHSPTAAAPHIGRPFATAGPSSGTITLPQTGGLLSETVR